MMKENRAFLAVEVFFLYKDSFFRRAGINKLLQRAKAWFSFIGINYNLARFLLNTCQRLNDLLIKLAYPSKIILH